MHKSASPEFKLLELFWISQNDLFCQVGPKLTTKSEGGWRDFARWSRTA